MICDPCQKAGAVNAIANRAVPEAARSDYREFAHELHTLCPGGTRCDCQHLIGVFYQGGAR